MGNRKGHRSGYGGIGRNRRKGLLIRIRGEKKLFSVKGEAETKDREVVCYVQENLPQNH